MDPWQTVRGKLFCKNISGRWALKTQFHSLWFNIKAVTKDTRGYLHSLKRTQTDVVVEGILLQICTDVFILWPRTSHKQTLQTQAHQHVAAVSDVDDQLNVASSLLFISAVIKWSFQAGSVTGPESCLSVLMNLFNQPEAWELKIRRLLPHKSDNGSTHLDIVIFMSTSVTWIVYL